jgi:hypothetical protein
VAAERRRRRAESQQPILTDGQAVTDGADGVGGDGHHAANSDVGGLLLHRLGGANPLCEGRPGRTPSSLTTLPAASPTPIWRVRSSSPYYSGCGTSFCKTPPCCGRNSRGCVFGDSHKPEVCRNGRRMVSL